MFSKITFTFGESFVDLLQVPDICRFPFHMRNQNEETKTDCSECDSSTFMNEVVVGTSYGLKLNYHNVDCENITEVTHSRCFKIHSPFLHLP